MKNTKRYLTNGYCISNDTWETGLNNNDLICGTTGCGKTRGYVIPNIKMSEESMIICDTKGVLYGEFASIEDFILRMMNANLDIHAFTVLSDWLPMEFPGGGDETMLRPVLALMGHDPEYTVGPEIEVYPLSHWDTDDDPRWDWDDPDLWDDDDEDPEGLPFN